MSWVCTLTRRHWYKLMTGGQRGGRPHVFWSKCRFCSAQRMRKGRP